MKNPIQRYRYSSPWVRKAAKAVDAAGYSWVREKGLPKEDIKRILLVRLDDIGDVLLATPVIRNLKEAFPGAGIDMLVKSSTKTIVCNNPCINRVWELDSFWMRSPEPFSLNRYVTLIRRLRKEKYDLTIELRGNPFNILLAFLLKSGHRAAYGAQGLGFLLNSVVPYEDKLKHQIERNLDVLRALRIPIRSQIPEFFISDAAMSSMEAFLKKYEIHGQDLLIAIHPGAAWPPKCWPLVQYAELVNALVDRYRAKILLLGGAGEVGLCTTLRDLVTRGKRYHVIIAAGVTNLEETAALIKKARLFVGSDSGPLHIAHALKTPSIGLFGPQSPEMYGPHQNPAVALYRKPECGPCIQKVAERCHQGLSCCKGLMSITPKDVLEAVRAFSVEWNRADTNAF